jgi:hypothetical protein
VHYSILRDFRIVEYLEREQSDKPRYIPNQDEFIKYAYEDYNDNNCWLDLRKFMYEHFGISARVSNAYDEIQDYVTQNLRINEVGSILENHNIIFDSNDQAQDFFNLLTTANNNSRSWENKGHTPTEMLTLQLERREKDGHPKIWQRKKAGQNDPCPCGSGKKYKKCCARIAEGESAQLPKSDHKLFYETWYKLLNFVNLELGVVNMQIKAVFPQNIDERKLSCVREKLWEDPELIEEFINDDTSLSDTEISLLKSWQEKHVKGKFILMRHTLDYSVFMGVEPLKLYAVKGITSSIADVLHRPLPIMLETILLPFNDTIIYDSYIAPLDIRFGESMMEVFTNDFEKTEQAEGLVFTL